MFQTQRTIREKVTLRGKGLHSGQQVRISLYPAAENEGVVFIRHTGGKAVEIPALHPYVVDHRLCTTLSHNGEIAATVEHFLAALYGLGIDNIRAELSAPELPILDGSAAPFVEACVQAGIKEQNAQKKYWIVTQKVTVRDGDRVASLSPAPELSIHCHIDFKHPVIPSQNFRWQFSHRHFLKDIARARTFGLLKDVEMLRSMGLVLGGGLDNAIVVDDFSILNQEGLRYSNEFVRHKILDGLGDVALLGRPLIGRLNLHKAGHALHCQLIAHAFKVGALVSFEPQKQAQKYALGDRELLLPQWEPQTEALLYQIKCFLLG